MAPVIDMSCNGRLPKLIKPFSWATSTQVNCPYCYANPGAISCSQCSQVQGSPPTVNAGPNQNLGPGSTSTTMAASATGASGAKIFQVSVAEISGPNTAIITFPSSFTTPISGLTTGIYKFRYTVTDQFQVTNTSDVIVTFNSYSKPPGRKRIYRQL